jgi:respiratory burst oxidase
LVGAFVYKFLLFKNDSAVGPWARIAKGFAQIIMVNTSFVLFPMCRNFVTAIRQLPLIVRYIPIDQHIEFHKICGVVMLVASVGHTLGWIMIVYYAKTCSKNDWKHSRFSPRLTFVREKPLMELIPRIPIATGIAMLLIALIAAPMTSTKIRRGNFNAFWLTHLLFLPFLLLIVVHGLEKWVATPQAYMYILFPCLVYFMEKRYRVSNVFGGQSKIVSIQLYAETVALYIKKPRSFGNRLKPGMYLFLNVPVLSRFEWHPFTISSAPDDELLSLHIQRAGDWTNALHHLLFTLKSNTRLALSSDGDIEQGATLPYPSISIDGPFGSPTYDYQRYRVLVLVAGGVGVTPFASILRSIVYTWESFRCGKCNRVQLPRTSFQITKIYFYWITRNQEQLTWFSSTINQLSEMDVDCRIEFHHYFSSLKRNSLVAPIKFLQTFIHDTDGQDIISGLHTKNLTHFGRPDWKNEIERIGKNHPEEEEIGVFICGSKKMSDSIDEECTNFNQRKLKTQYDFHAEIF